MKIITLLIASTALLGCSVTHNVNVGNAPAIDLYSSYNDKVPGKWALVLETSKLAALSVVPDGSSCRGHKHNIDVAHSFAPSIISTLSNVFESVVIERTTLSRSLASEAGYRGQIIVRGETFDAELRFIQAFWDAEYKASVKIVLSASIDGTQGRLYGSTVVGDAAATSSASATCEGGSKALGDATEGAVRESLLKLGEGMANSQRIRDYSG